MVKKNLIVCIIDDDDIHQYIMQTAINGVVEVKKIIPFLSAGEALHFLSDVISDVEKIPDIIFLDLNMPEMDGREFLAELTPFFNRLAKKPKIWVLSSSTLKSDVEIKLEFPIIESYFIKPLGIEEIHEKIKQVSIE